MYDIFRFSLQHWECKLLMTMFNYATMASHMWIFVEGLYLHTYIIVAVFSEKTHIKYYFLLGWGKCSFSSSNNGPLISVND